MKGLLVFLLLISLLSNRTFSSSCDSVVVAINKRHIHNDWVWSSTSINRYSEGLLTNYELFSTSYSHSTSYSYDSLNRLREEIYDGTLKTVYLYNVQGKDSSTEFYSNNGSVYKLISVILYEYDANLALFKKIILDNDTNTNQLDTNSITLSYYSLDSLTRYDSVIVYPGGIVTGYEVLEFDSLRRLLHSSYSNLYGAWMGSLSKAYDSVCVDRLIYDRASRAWPGLGGSSTTNVLHYFLDSLCRPLISLDTNRTHASGHSWESNGKSEYFYADCNTIVIVGMDTLVTCRNQPVNLNVYATGGSGDYNNLWTPANLLSSDTVLSPTIYPDTTGMYYQLTVVDTNGNSAHFGTFIAINYFSTSIDDASCYTCTNGSVTLNFTGDHPAYEFTVSPNAGAWTGNILSGLGVGGYEICSRHGACTYCDSVYIVSPISVDEVDLSNGISIYPLPANEKFIVHLSEVVFQTGLNWKLYDLQGRIVSQGLEYNSEFTIDASEVSKGFYNLEIISGGRGVKRVIIY